MENILLSLYLFNLNGFLKYFFFFSGAKAGKKGKKGKGSDSDSDSDWGKSKKASGGGGGAKKGGGKGSGYTKAYTLSSELSALVGAKQMARHEVVKKVWSIIKERNLYVRNIFNIILIAFKNR